MLRVCPDSSNCPPFDPVGNFSSEADDSLDYISTVWSADDTPPPLLHNWTATNCGFTYVSQISQLDADQNASVGAILCITHDHCPDCTLFVNSPQTCCVPCPDGSQSCYTVPGGIIVDVNQTSADAQASRIACLLVERNKVCLGKLPACTCVGSDYEAALTATQLVDWSIVGGILPPGLTFFGGTSRIATISGVPLINGQYTFRIRGQTAAGPYSEKTFTITVLEIVTTSIPGYTVGVPYSFQLDVQGGSGDYNWKITSGSLPPGLIMSLTGLISGTPT